MIHVCVPVLRRYDLLRRMLESLDGSTVPYDVQVIDNGCSSGQLLWAIGERRNVDILVGTGRPMGVAESWNYFIRCVSEERIIANDDVVFASDSLERLAATPYDLSWSFEAGFSCFLIRDACVAKVGLFDETISPGYAYFEDEDYMMRVNGKGARPSLVACGHTECGVQHPKQSETLNAATRRELGEHHRKFMLAKVNFARKWGREALARVEGGLQ